MCKHILFTEFDKNVDIDILKHFASMTYDNDGFGAIARTKANDLITLKSMDKCSFYFDLSTLINENELTQLVVHHRTSTNGKGIEYAHPFEHDGNLLTHNGVVTMPVNYTTTTTNDSEKLLHHLIKTDYNTNDIRGYFSCFILNTNTTTVLVDTIAPIYTDGIIYSSHQIYDDMRKIENKRIVYDIVNNTMTDIDIETIKTDYGKDKKHLSLGNNKSDDYLYNDWEKDYLKKDYVNASDLFLKKIKDDDLYFIYHKQDRKDQIVAIKTVAEEMELKLDHYDMEEILEFLKYSA